MELVILDCDGVLIDSELISAQMLIEELARLGLRIDTTRLDLTYRAKYKAHLPGQHRF